MAQSNRLNDERSIRAAVDANARRLSQAENNDVIMGDGRRLILRSPNGHFWNITVGDTGTLTAVDMGTTL